MQMMDLYFSINTTRSLLFKLYFPQTFWHRSTKYLNVFSENKTLFFKYFFQRLNCKYIRRHMYKICTYVEKHYLKKYFFQRLNYKYRCRRLSLKFKIL